MAFYLKKLKKFYEEAGIMSNEMVLTVPSYFSNAER